MKRRHFFSTALASVSAGWIVNPLRGQSVFDPPEEEVVRISLFHTTDLHGHILPTTTYEGVEDVGGLGRCLTQIRKWQRSADHHLTIDIGDLYQGTHVSYETEGELMIRLLNSANFDAWIAGNHDFDWGERVFQTAVERFDGQVLSANLVAGGHPAGSTRHAGGPHAGLRGTMVREIEGIRIGIIGITTPGLPFWLNPSQLGTVQALDPLAEVRRAILELQEQGVHAIVAAGHMGLKGGDGDDYANQVNRIVRGCPEIDVYVAGHTHRDRPSTVIGDTLFTQAGYFGIWAGRLDLTFLREGGKLIRRDAETLLMDREIEIDPVVWQIAGPALERSKEEMGSPVGRLAIGLENGSFDREGTDIQSLIAAGMRHALKKKGEQVDGVLHGSFSRDPLEPGIKTLADMWEIIPYENRIVTATLTGEELDAVAEEAFTESFGRRRLVGFTLEATWNRDKRLREVSDMRGPGGQPVAPGDTFRIAFNSYDAQSGGRRMLRLRELLQRPEARTVYHPIDTRQALIDFFLDQEVVTEKSIATAGA